MHKIEIGNKIIDYPAKWNELTAEQLLFFSEKTIENKALIEQGEVEYFQYKTAFQLMYKWLNVDNELFFEKITPSVRHELYELNLFLFNSNRLSVFPVKSFEHNAITYYAPQAGLGNFEFYEFCMCEKSFSKYIETKEITHLNELIGIIYRKKSQKSKRESFSAIEVTKNGKRIERINFTLKNAIYLNYIGCRNLLAQLYPNALPHKGEGETAKADPFIYEKMLNDIAGAKFGKPSEVERQQLHQVMLYIEESIKDSKKK